MEASAAEQIVNPETTPTEQAAPAQPEPQAAPEQPAGGEQTPDLSEQVTALQQEISAIRGALPQQDPQQPTDLYTQLSGGPEQDPGYDPEGVYDDPASGGYGLPEPQGVDPFDEAIRERVAEIVSPILEGIETDRRRGQLEDIAQEHPELRDQETQIAIADRLAPLAERYGSELILTDPDLVRNTLIALKAEAAAANEVPANQAATAGARIETGAGASNPTAQPSAEEAIVQGIVNAGGGGSPFV